TSMKAGAHSAGQSIGMPVRSRNRSLEEIGESILLESFKHLLGLIVTQRIIWVRELDKSLQRVTESEIGSFALRKHLLQELFIQRLLPWDAQCFGLDNIACQLIEYTE